MDKPDRTFRNPFFRPNPELMAASTVDSGASRFLPSKKSLKGIVAGQLFYAH